MPDSTQLVNRMNSPELIVNRLKPPIGLLKSMKPSPINNLLFEENSPAENNEETRTIAQQQLQQKLMAGLSQSLNLKNILSKVNDTKQEKTMLDTDNQKNESLQDAKRSGNLSPLSTTLMPGSSNKKNNEENEKREREKNAAQAKDKAKKKTEELVKKVVKEAVKNAVSSVTGLPPQVVEKLPGFDKISNGIAARVANKIPKQLTNAASKLNHNAMQEKEQELDMPGSHATPTLTPKGM